MGTGPGSADAQGIYQYGEDDTETLMSDLLNIGQQSVSDALVLDRARLDNLEDDTGWIQVTAFLNGWSALTNWPVKRRRLHGVVYWQGRLTGGIDGHAFVIPAGFLPANIGPGLGRFWKVDNGASTTTSTRAAIQTAAPTYMDLIGGSTPDLSAIIYPADA